MSKTAWMFIIAAVIAIGGYLGYQHWRDAQAALPSGIASGNGRIEAKLVDITPKEALRVKEILVDEGDLVKPGQVVVRMDTATLDAQLAEASSTSWRPKKGGSGQLGPRSRAGRRRSASPRPR